MTAIRFFTDEDVYGAVATALRRARIDALSTPEVRRRGQSDESQLEWASAEGRVIVTFNLPILQNFMRLGYGKVAAMRVSSYRVNDRSAIWFVVYSISPVHSMLSRCATA